MVKMFHLYGVMEDIEGQMEIMSGGKEKPMEASQFFLSKSDNRINGKKYGLIGCNFWAPGPPELTFIGSKRC